MPLAEEYSNTLVVKVDGRPLPDDVAPLLVAGYVDDASNLPSLFELRFTDPDALVIAKGGFKIGAKVELGLQSSDPGGVDKLLVGEVTALEIDLDQHGRHATVRGLDVLHKLLRGTKVRAFHDVLASDIVRTVCSEAGLHAKVTTTQIKYQHFAQDAISDWEFLERLAEDNGYTLSATDGTVTFAPRIQASGAPSGSGGARQDAQVLEYGVNLASLRGTVSGQEQVPDVQVRGWNPGTKQPVVATKQALTHSAALDQETPAKLAQAGGGASYQVSAPTLATQPECDLMATSLADHLAGGFAELDGVARGNPALRSGVPVALVGVGAPFEGRYVLSATRHTFSGERGYLTSFTVGNTSERSLYGTITGRGGGSAAGAPPVVPALVTNLKDPEKLGRVRVKFPSLADNYESWWARPVQVGAGAKRGQAWLPEVGDEVLVVFGGDGHLHPYVIGGLFNGKDKPDKAWEEHLDSGSGAVKRRALVSRTGMCVEWLEAPGGERLQITTNEGKQLVSLIQKPQPSIEVTTTGPLKVTADKDVEVTSKTGKVSVSAAAGGVSVKGQKVEVEGTAEVTVKAPKLALNASAQLQLQGTTVSLQASGPLEIKGAIVKIN